LRLVGVLAKPKDDGCCNLALLSTYRQIGITTGANRHFCHGEQATAQNPKGQNPYFHNAPPSDRTIGVEKLNVIERK
jgi:hypothetical protein